ncbi:MAG: hypothetical protein K9I36_13965 [Bacteroidia bacterium]|nr:hypothetical protein [Bacteroidia bacterium]MCF8427839.1 hypothetical protein [Bacteroidia bacterium]
MKNLRITLTIILFTIPFVQALAQTEIYGKWNATCFFERAENGSLKSCDLCPLEPTPDGKSILISSIEMEFTKEKLIITSNGKSVEFAYTWNTVGDVISFERNGHTYKFKLLQCTDPDKKILHGGSENQILFLESKNPKNSPKD